MNKIDLNTGEIIINGILFTPSSYIQDLWKLDKKKLNLIDRGQGQFLAIFKEKPVSGKVHADIRISATPIRHEFSIIIFPEDKRPLSCKKWIENISEGEIKETYPWGRLSIKEYNADVPYSRPEIRIGFNHTGES